MAGRRWSRPSGRSPLAEVGLTQVGSRRSRAPARSPTSTSRSRRAARSTSETFATDGPLPDPGCGCGRARPSARCRPRLGKQAAPFQGCPPRPPSSIHLGGSVAATELQGTPLTALPCVLSYRKERRELALQRNLVECAPDVLGGVGVALIANFPDGSVRARCRAASSAE